MSRPRGLTMLFMRLNHAARRTRRFYLRTSHAHSGVTRPPGGMVSRWKIMAGRRSTRAPCKTSYGILVPIRRIKREDKARHLRWKRWFRLKLIGVTI